MEDYNVDLDDSEMDLESVDTFHKKS